MGIAGLARRLEPYATRLPPESLAGYNAIIDGPSLAYHAYKLALAASGSLACVPSYADIHFQALRWLKALEDVQIKVSAIVFDGALPDTKKNERVSRLEQNNQKVRNFRINYPTAACPMPTRLGHVSYAFLAPALREVLCESEYASITCTVPGEADDWCAQYAFDSVRSIVFSNDTDLLLYDHREDYLVAFFNEVELWPEPDFRAYSPFKISQSLNLSSLVPFAYSIIQEPLKTFNELLEDARRVDGQPEDDYHYFSLRYSLETLGIHNTSTSSTSTSQYLDARVAEFVNQALEPRPVSVIFPPLLVEDPNQASAYNIGRDIRLLAYSLLAPRPELTLDWRKLREKERMAQEYVRKAQTITMHELRLYTPREICDAAASLADDIAAILLWTVEREVPQQYVWLLVALNLVLTELPSPPKPSLVHKIFYADFDNTWGFIHLAARFQAALYSLRFLKQCIAVWVSLHEGRSEAPRQHMDSLDRSLESMPWIQDLFIVPGQAKKPSEHQELLRELIGDVYASGNVEVPSEQISNKKRKKQEREAVRKGKRRQEANGQQGGNIFDILDKST